MMYIYKEIEEGKTYYVCEKRDEETGLLVGTCDRNLESAVKRFGKADGQPRNKAPENNPLAEQLSEKEFKKARTYHSS